MDKNILEREENLKYLIQKIDDACQGWYTPLIHEYYLPGGIYSSKDTVEELAISIAQYVVEIHPEWAEFYIALMKAMVAFLETQCNPSDQILGSILKLAQSFKTDDIGLSFKDTVFGIMYFDAKDKYQSLHDNTEKYIFLQLTDAIEEEYNKLFFETDYNPIIIAEDINLGLKNYIENNNMKLSAEMVSFYEVKEILEKAIEKILYEITCQSITRHTSLKSEARIKREEEIWREIRGNVRKSEEEYEKWQEEQAPIEKR